MSTEVNVLDVLTDDCLAHIFSFVPVNRYPSLAGTCKQFAAALDDDNLWRSVCHKYDLTGTAEELATAVAESGDTVSWRALFRSWSPITFEDAHMFHALEVVKEELPSAPAESASSSATGTRSSKQTLVLQIREDYKNDSEYKGCYLKNPLPDRGAVFVEYTVGFDDSTSNDHLSIGVATGLTLERPCFDGWSEENSGIGWYSSNGATYIYGSSGPTCSVFASGDRVGLLLDRTAGTLSFCHNGVIEATIHRTALKKGTLYPCLIVIARCLVRVLRSGVGASAEQLRARMNVSLSSTHKDNDDGGHHDNDNDDDDDDDDADDDDDSSSSSSSGDEEDKSGSTGWAEDTGSNDWDHGQ